MLGPVGRDGRLDERLVEGALTVERPPDQREDRLGVAVDVRAVVPGVSGAPRAQESLLRGLRALHTLEAPEKFGPWLRGIAKRVCLDWRKSKQSAQVPFTSFAPDQRPDELAATGEQATEGEVDRADELRQLMNEVESLGDDHREVLMLYYYQDVTYCDLAELLGVSTATINARLTKARAILRQRLSSSRR